MNNTHINDISTLRKKGRVGVTGLEIIGDLIIDGVAGLSNFLEFMATFEEEVEDASCDVDDELSSPNLLTL
ncbi:unnamed protein product [Rhizophagus irregularis]|nr:unnamed protein product [Rhizophagus irregularis]